jgi:hypothetical protein
LGPALCFLKGAATVAGAVAILATIHFPFAHAAEVNPLPSTASSRPIGPELACPQIRDAVHKLAEAERNEALALHLMADGKPTPVVQTRLTELQEQIGNLREILRRARKGSPRHNPDVQECLSMGFQSLNDAENVSRQIQDIVMDEGGPLGLPPQIKSGGSGAPQLPEPPLPPAPSRAE